MVYSLCKNSYALQKKGFELCANFPVAQSVGGCCIEYTNVV